MGKMPGSSRQKQTPSASPPRRNAYIRSKNPDSGAKKYRAVTLLIVSVVVLCMFATSLIRIGRSLLETGSFTEGKGSGTLQISDSENIIYDSVLFGYDEEYGEVAEQDDVRLYSGVQISISGSAVLTFTASNAQPFTREITAYPLTETVSLSEGTGITLEGDPVELIPGDGYFEINFADYPWNT